MVNFLLINIGLTKNHFGNNKGIEQPLTFVIGYRQYIQYHLQAMKTSMHSRMRTRVNAFERVIIQARRDKEPPKNWKENFGGATMSSQELQEEEKKEIYKHKK